MIGIQYPSFNRSLLEEPYSKTNPHTVLEISDYSVATSGDYRNYFIRDGIRYSHIISPRSGYPIQSNVVSVSVVSKKCLAADALATALMVMDIEDGINLVESLDGFDSFYILDDSSVRHSTGIKDFLN